MLTTEKQLFYISVTLQRYIPGCMKPPCVYIYVGWLLTRSWFSSRCSKTSSPGKAVWLPKYTQIIRDATVGSVNKKGLPAWFLQRKSSWRNAARARMMRANLKQPRLKWLLRFVTLVKQSRSDRATESCLRTQRSDTHKQKQAWKQIYLYMDATACAYINTINDCIQCTCKRSNRWHECTAGRDESNWGIRA